MYSTNCTGPSAIFDAAGADDYASLAEGYAATLPAARESELSAAVGVSVDRLRSWSVGWSEPKREFTIGLQAAGGATIGLLAWNGNGRRTIGQVGLILPPHAASCRGATLFVTVGACDTLVAAELGQPVVGLSGPLATNELSAFLKRQRPTEVVFLQNGIDDPRLSTNAIPTLLRRQGWSVAIVAPPDGIGGFVARRVPGATSGKILATGAESSQIMAGDDRVAA